MRTQISTILYILVFGLISHNSKSQFYSDSSATWCLFSPENDIFIELIDKDTIFANTQYKIVNEYSNNQGNLLLTQAYYVRSQSNGQGFVYLPDSLTEYCTGDVNSAAGDTLENILVANNYCAGFSLQSVVVDSVVSLTNNGITIQRLYVHVPCTEQVLSPIDYFWQLGLGTSFGPYLRMTATFGQEHIFCATANGEYVFSFLNSAHGLPGAPCGCLPLTVGLDPHGVSEIISISPNPSTGIFTIRQPAEQISVYNAQGRLLSRQHDREVDLSAYPPGLYHAVVRTAQGVGHVRLMVVR